MREQDAEFWRSFLNWSQRIRTTVNRAVTEAADISVPEFEVLDRLRLSPDREVTQLNLTTDLGWSASRMSHLLNRLEERSFIDRADTGRGRARTVRLAEAGEERLHLARDAHTQAVHAVLLDRLDERQRTTLLGVMGDLGKQA